MVYYLVVINWLRTWAIKLRFNLIIQDADRVLALVAANVAKLVEDFALLPLFQCVFVALANGVEIFSPRIGQSIGVFRP